MSDQEHVEDEEAPAYCMCGELTRLCPARPREYRNDETTPALG